MTTATCWSTPPGPAGTSSFSWDGDARLAARSDLEGTPRQFTTAFAWSDLDELARVEEPLTATAVAYRFDAASQLVAVDYGGGGSRSLALDDLGRVTGDTLADSEGLPTLSQVYGYDRNGDVRVQQVASANTVPVTGGTTPGSRDGVHAYAHYGSDIDSASRRTHGPSTSSAIYGSA